MILAKSKAGSGQEESVLRRIESDEPSRLFAAWPEGTLDVSDAAPCAPWRNEITSMCNRFRTVGLMLLGLALAVPKMTVAQDKKADDLKADVKQTAKSKPYEKPKPDWIAEYVGKLTELDEKDTGRIAFTVQVTYKYPELNTDAQRQIAQHQQTLAQQQLQLARAKTPQDRQNALNQIASTSRQIDQSTAQLYKLKDVSFDVKCQAADEMRVRKYQPVQKVDPESGEFIKMSKELIDQAKGREGYPGYQADVKILKTGQMVKIYLWKDSITPNSLLEKAKKDNKKIDDIRNDLKNLRYDVIM